MTDDDFAEDVIDNAIVRAVGEELRRVRMAAGWSRPELVKHMATRMPVNTYACYEQGIRQCPIPRLVEICQALGVDMPELLHRALQRLKPANVPRLTVTPHGVSGLLVQDADGHPLFRVPSENDLRAIAVALLVIADRRQALTADQADHARRQCEAAHRELPSASSYAPPECGPEPRTR